MDNQLLHSDYVFDPSSGRTVDSRIVRIAQVLKDYDENLELQWVEPENRVVGEDNRVFRVVMKEPGKAAYEVLRCREDEVDHRLIAKIWSGDQRRHKVEYLGDLEQQAKELVDAKAWEDRMAEAREVANAFLKTPLHTYRFSKDKVFRW